MKFLRLLIPAVLLLAASIILTPIVLFSQAATFLPTINIVPKIVPIDPNTGEAVVELDSEDTESDSASGEILLHEWDLNDDGIFDDASTALVSHVFRFDPVPQGRVTRVVRLRATDAEGNAAVGIYEIEFQTPPAPPHPDAGGPYTVEPGGGCRLDASSSYDPDPEEYISKVEWDLDGDGRFDVIYDNGTAISNPATLTLDLTPADLTAYGMTEADAAYPVTLKITDSNSQSSETTATITILASSGDSQEHGKDGGSEENTSGDLDAPFSLSSESADSTLPTAVLSFSAQGSEPTSTGVAYVITATSGSGGTISPAGSITVNEGDNQSFTITPNAGYQIRDVIVDGVSAGPVSGYTFAQVAADHAIEASFAREVRWAAAVDGNWNDPTKWDIGTVPGENDFVFIDAAGGSYTVTLNVNPTVTGLTLDAAEATLSAASRTLTVNGPSTLSAGTVEWFNSTWQGSGTLTNDARMILQQQACKILTPFVQNGELIVRGSSDGNANLTVKNSFENTGAITLYSTDTGRTRTVTLVVYNNGVLTNTGTIYTHGVLIPDTGTFEDSDGWRQITANLVNNGSIYIDAPTNFNKAFGTITNEGAIHLYTGKTLTFNNSYMTLNQNSGTMKGDLTWSGLYGSFNINGGTLDVGGSFQMTYFDAFTYNGGAIAGSPTIELTYGELNLGESGTSPVTFRMMESCSISGNIAPGQTVIVESAGSNASLTAAAGFTNAGTLTLTSTSTANRSTTLTVNGGVLTNTGTLNFESGNGGIRNMAADLINTGTVAVNTDVNFDKADAVYTNEGDFTVAGSTSLTVSGSHAVFNQDAGTLTVNGTLAWSGYQGIFNLNDGTLAVSGAMQFTNIDTFNFNGGDITGSPAIEFTDGRLNLDQFGSSPATFWMTGACHISGNIDSGQTVIVESAGADSYLTAAAGFTNAGALTLTSTANHSTTLTVNGGALANSGTLNFESGSGGLRYLTADLVNTGTVSVNTDTHYNKSSGAVTTYGAFTVAAEKTLFITATNAEVHQTGGLFTLNGNFASTGSGAKFFLEGGVLDINAGFTLRTGTFNYVNGALADNPLILLINSTLFLDSSGISPAVFQMLDSCILLGDVKAGQTLLVNGTQFYGAASLDAPYGFTNAGAIVLETISDLYSTSLTVNGTLLNTGFLIVNTGTGGARYFYGSMDNRGVVRVEPALLFGASNAGIVNAESGIFEGTGEFHLSAHTTIGFANQGLISPGMDVNQTGILTIRKNAVPNQSSSGIHIDISSTLEGEYDRLAITGHMIFGGQLTVELLNGFTPSFGDRFTIMTYESYEGSFERTQLPTLPPGLNWVIDYQPTELILKVANGEPTANDDTAETNEDSPATIAVLSNDSDEDGDSLTIVSVTQGSNGTVTTDGAIVIYSPNADFFGTDTFTYTIGDGNGLTASASVTVTVISANDSPVPALGGPFSVNEGAAVTFAASASDIDSDTLTYFWDFDYDGTNFVPGASGIDLTAPVHVYADDGSYVVALRVHDEDGGISEIIASEVTVNDLSPTAAFSWSPEPQVEGDPVAFTDASSSAPDVLSSRSWDFGALAASSDQHPSYTFIDNGAYTVSLTVTDEDGSTHTVSNDVTITNVAPVVIAGTNPTAFEGSLVSSTLATFVDVGTTDTHTATINWGDGAIEPGIIAQGTGVGTVEGSHLYTDNGIYTVFITVFDDDGGFTSDTSIITIDNAAPQVEAGDDQTAAEGSIVYLETSTFTDNGTADTHTATIDWGDGSVENGAVTQGAGGGTIDGSHTYVDDGTYTVTITVTDNDEASASDTFSVAVANATPEVDAGSDHPVGTYETVNLDPATFSDSGSADTHTAEIDWGDGTVVEGIVDAAAHNISGSHEYLDEGAYTVTVTVTDDDGDSGSDTFTVTVETVNPYDLKEDVIDMIGPFKDASKRIRKAIREVEQSLDPRFWQDDFHLDRRQGHRVFSEEQHAVKELLHLKLCDDDDGDTSCDGIRSLRLRYAGKQTARIQALNKKSFLKTFVCAPQDTFLIEGDPEDENRIGSELHLKIKGKTAAKINTSCSKPIRIGDRFGNFIIVDIIKIMKEIRNRHRVDDCADNDAALEAAHNAIDDLVEADRIIALVSIREAEAMEANKPHLQWSMDLLLKEAWRMIGVGDANRDKGESIQAILSYKKAWEYSQAAMKIAEKDSKKHHKKKKR